MDKPVYTKNEVAVLVRRYKDLLKERGVRAEHVFIFGSYAHGTPHPWSDIDVAVVSDEFGADPIAEGVRLDEIADEVSVALEPHPVNTDEFAIGILPFVREIKTAGVEI